MRILKSNVAKMTMLLISCLVLSGCVTGRQPYTNNNSGRTNINNARSMDNGEMNSQLVFTCGTAGMGVDFVTGNCVSSGGSQVNPYNVAPNPFSLPRQDPGD